MYPSSSGMSSLGLLTSRIFSSNVPALTSENAFYATDMLKKALVENTKAPVTEEELDGYTPTVVQIDENNNMV